MEELKDTVSDPLHYNYLFMSSVSSPPFLILFSWLSTFLTPPSMKNFFSNFYFFPLHFYILCAGWGSTYFPLEFSVAHSYTSLWLTSSNSVCLFDQLWGHSTSLTCSGLSGLGDTVEQGRAAGEMTSAENFHKCPTSIFPISVCLFVFSFTLCPLLMAQWRWQETVCVCMYYRALGRVSVRLSAWGSYILLKYENSTESNYSQREKEA